MAAGERRRFGEPEENQIETIRVGEGVRQVLALGAI
jgi:hypothetical protein